MFRRLKKLVTLVPVLVLLFAMVWSEPASAQAVVAPVQCAGQAGTTDGIVWVSDAMGDTNICKLPSTGGPYKVVDTGAWAVIAMAGTWVPCGRDVGPNSGVSGFINNGATCSYTPLVAADIAPGGEVSRFIDVQNPGRVWAYCGLGVNQTWLPSHYPEALDRGVGYHCPASATGTRGYFGYPWAIDPGVVDGSHGIIVAGVTSESFAVPMTDPEPNRVKIFLRSELAGVVPVDNCLWVAGGGADYSNSIVSLPSSGSTVSLRGTTCGVSGLRATVTSAGAAGAVLTWIGVDNFQYSFLVRAGRLFYAHEGNGVDLGPWQANMIFEWETQTGRVRSQSPGGAMSPWTDEIVGAKLARDASTPPRLLLFGHPSTASAGTVLNLGGSNLSIDVPPGTDPTTGQPPGGGAHSGCGAIDSIGFDPSSWVPGLIGGVECVVGGAIDRIKVLLIPNDINPYLNKLNAATSRPPLSYVVSGVAFVRGTSVSFTDGSSSSACSAVIRGQSFSACPQNLGGLTAPVWVWPAILTALWLAIIAAIVRWL